MYHLHLRKVLIVIAVVLVYVGCRSPEASEIPFQSEQTPAPSPVLEKSGILIEFPELGLSFGNVDADDFYVNLQARTATIEQRTYTGIDGSTIRVERSQLSGLTARIRFELGFLQYLTDDVRASPLDLSHQTAWTALEIRNSEIQIPQFYKDRENVIEVYEQLGFQSEQDFLRSLEDEYFEKVKPISYRTQKEYFTNLLRSDRARYEQCCPEYIEQAAKWLSRPIGEFRTFETLGVEIFLQKLTLEIDGVDKAGKPLKFSVIGTN